MKIKKGFVVQNIQGSYVACSTGKLTRDFSGAIKMNESGVFIFNQLKEDITFEELTQRVCAQFSVPLEIAERDVAAFLKNLTENGLIE